MKLNISDLLDGYQEETLVVEGQTPLSMKRIERMTIAAVKPRKKHPVRGFAFKALVAAALISLLAVTAIAEERERKVSDWFRPAVDMQVQEEVRLVETEEMQIPRKTAADQYQLAVIDEHGKVVNQSVTKNGATVTLLALYGDEYILNLYLRVEAPEGTVLPDGKYRFCQPNSQAIPITVPAGYKTRYLHFPAPQTMPDEDPADNKKDFMISLNIGNGEWSDGSWKTWTFNDSAPKKFIMRGLYLDTGYQKVDYQYQQSYETLFIGPFEFDVTNDHAVRRREIDLTGCDYSGHVQEAWHPGKEIYEWDYTFTVMPIKLAVSPFTVETEARFTGEMSVIDFQIVMKDGSVQEFGYWEYGAGFAGSESREEDGYSKNVLRFTSPIDPEQIDYILVGGLEFGDTIHKVYP